MGYAIGIASDNIEFTGQWSLNGDILSAGKYGYKEKISISGDSLIKRLQGTTGNTICKKDF